MYGDLWKCDMCGMTFDVPGVRKWREFHGEFYEPMAVDVCPFCGSEYLDIVIDEEEEEDEET